jgi:feruloyl-CoA synthase
VTRVASEPWRDVRLGEVKIDREERPDGTMVLRSLVPLEECPVNAAAAIRHWAETTPDRTFVADRDDGGWRRLTFGEARRQVDAIGQALLDRGLSPERPLAILSRNSVEHVLLTYAGMAVGVPVAPISVAYSLLSRDHQKLRRIIELIRPGLVFADNKQRFGPALASLDLDGIEVVTCRASPPDRTATAFVELATTPPTAAVDGAYRAVRAETVAKILFTSGSTGEPKGVITTHGMLTANQQQLVQIWPFLLDTPPVLVDWLPWNHTFGGNNNLGVVASRGGTLYIDHGRPAEGMFDATVANLREVSPTIYYNVPAGFSMLVPRLEADPELAARFFNRVQVIVYAGAALPQHLWERLDAAAVAATGERIVLAAGWGSTETAPMATFSHFPTERTGNIGVPVPGVDLKLVPSGARYELRVRGRNVTPGYFRRPDLTAAAFDEEGFYRIHDAGRLIDPGDPAKGLEFAGRIAEDFKLGTGTWIHVGPRRLAVLAACDLIRDAVVTAPDRGYVGLLGWPHVAETQEVAGPDATSDPAALASHPAVRDAVRHCVARHNREHPGSSERIRRVLLLTEPPSIDAGEVTDKGYVNQRRVLERRAALVDRLYEDPAPSDVIVIDPAGS